MDSKERLIKYILTDDIERARSLYNKLCDRAIGRLSEDHRDMYGHPYDSYGRKRGYPKSYNDSIRNPKSRNVKGLRGDSGIKKIHDAIRRSENDPIARRIKAGVMTPPQID